MSAVSKLNSQLIVNVTSVAHQLITVTNNTSHFKRIKQIK